MVTHSLNTGTHKEGEEGDVMFIFYSRAVPITYCTYVVSMDRQQHQPREKRKVYCWYYYHSYNSSHPAGMQN